MKKQVLFIIAMIIAFGSHGQIITTFAGNGTNGYSGDGGLATAAELSQPYSLAVDASGNIYFKDGGRIRKVNSATGIITTVAGNGSGISSGDGGLATAAELDILGGIAVDDIRNIYIAESRFHRIRKVNSITGIITTIAGNGTWGYSGDGGLATNAKITNPSDVAIDASGNIYIADNGNKRIRKVNSTTGIITTLAGNGTSGYSGDGGLATTASLNSLTGLTVDASGNIYISDFDNNRIRKVNSNNGIITTVAGNGTSGYSGDGGLATTASIYEATDISLDIRGNIYIADRSNRIRKVNITSGIITTVAGNGTFGYSGDGGIATDAEITYPHGVAIDVIGSIYISDIGNHRIRKVTNTTSVAEHFRLSSILISPNPFNNTSLIQLPESVQNAEINVSDLLGKKVVANKFSGKEYVLEKGTMSPGVYFVQISDGQHQYPVTKIVIQ